MGFLMTTESQDLGLTSHPKDCAKYLPQNIWIINIIIINLLKVFFYLKNKTHLTWLENKLAKL